MEDKDEVVYPLRIKKTLWKKFKETIPHSISSINTALVELIEKEVNKKK